MLKIICEFSFLPFMTLYLGQPEAYVSGRRFVPITGVKEKDGGNIQRLTFIRFYNRSRVLRARCCPWKGLPIPFSPP